MANENRYYKTPFAESGNKAEVPNVSVGGAVGFDSGFGPDYELPQGSPSRKRIERDLYNGMHFGITKNIKQWQEGLYPTWIEDDGTGVAFAYPQGMIVNHAGQDWVSNEDANQEEPGAGVKWKVYSPVTSLQDLSGLTDPSDLDKTYQRAFENVNDMIAYTGHTLGNLVKVAGVSGYDNYVVVTGETPNGYNIIDLGYGSLQLKRVERHQDPSMQGYGAGIGLSFIQQINNNRRDVNLLVQGDSTGNETYEWVYLTALKLVSAYPTHTVNYFLWNTGSDNYDSPQVLGTGSGSFSINVYNASVSGSSAVYFDGSRKVNCYAGKSFDLIIQNYGHNGATAAGVNEVAMRTLQHAIQLVQDQPQSEIALTLQNIDTSVPDYSGRQVQATKLVADILGLPTINVRSVFGWAENQGILASWMGDSVHPNTTGQQVWSDIVWYSLLNPEKQSFNARNVLNEKIKPRLDNSQFASWAWSETLPSGWEVANATITKESTINETGSWSVKCVGTAASTGIFIQNYNQFLLDRTAGTDCTFMARVYIPSANGSINAGRVDITTSLGSISVDPYVEVRDGWTWMLVTAPSSLLDGAATFRVGLFTGDNTDTLYIDRVSLVEGRLPFDSYREVTTLSDYYDPSNALSHGTNVITVVGDSVTLDSTGEAFPSWYLNVYGMVPNEAYTMTWVSASASGTVLARAELGDNGTVLATATPLNTNTITWRPSKSTGSLQISNSAGTEPFTLDDIKIIKT